MAALKKDLICEKWRPFIDKYLTTKHLKQQVF